MEKNMETTIMGLYEDHLGFRVEDLGGLGVRGLGFRVLGVSGAWGFRGWGVEVWGSGA